MKRSKSFTKITLALIITNATYASEYIVSNYNDNNREQIYEVVSKYRFPSILSKFIQKEFKEKYPKLDLEKTFGTKEAEYNFILDAVKNIDSKAKVFAIPKSLYQFMVYDYFAETIPTPETCTAKTLFKNINEQKDRFDLLEYAKEDEEWGLTKACSRFMADEKIKNIFWKVNDYAKDLYMKNEGKTKQIINELFEAYKVDDESKSAERLLDEYNLNAQEGISAQIKAEMSRLEILLGVGFLGKELVSWDKEKRQELKRYITNCIESEKNTEDYVLYHGGMLENLNYETVNRQCICLSDGLFSGWIFDPGANAFALSNGSRKLYKLGLDRVKLLLGGYPIFIPTASHLLSAGGRGEFFHGRTDVVDAVMDCANVKHIKIDNYALSIKSITEPLTVGYALNQTPEFFTTQNPQILLKKYDEHYNLVYEITDQGVFDKDGAEKLITMIKTITEVPSNGIF